MLAKRMKKSLALLLATVMVLGLLPVSAFAAGSSGQIGQYMDLGTNETFDTSRVSNEDGTVVVEKNIASTSVENEFDITLKVATTEDLTEVPVSADAAVVLVIDASYSMMYNDEGQCEYDWVHGKNTCSHHRSESFCNNYWPVESEQRLSEAKQAAIDFIKDFASGAEGSRRMVSVVSFNGGADRVQNWVDAAQLDWSGNENALTRAIKGISPDGSTNIDAGLTLAYNLLNPDEKNNAAIKEIKSTYTVLLTDGAPNRTAGNSTNTENIGSGSSASAEAASVAAGETAGKIRNERKAILYSIAFAADGEGLYNETIKTPVEHPCTIATPHQHTRSEIGDSGYGDGKKGYIENGVFHQHTKNCPNGEWWVLVWVDNCTNNWFEGPHTGTTTDVSTHTVTVGEWLASISSRDGYFNAPNGGSLSISFDDIVERIRTLASAWQVTDPMGAFIINPVINTKDSEAVIKDGQLSWNLWDEKFEAKDIDGKANSAWKLYSVSYRVTLDTAAQAFVPNQLYPTNGRTYLEYFAVSDVLDENGNIISNVKNQLKEIDFRVPTVKGERPKVNYSIEYYLWDKESGNYPERPTDTSGVREGALWDQKFAPEKYAEKYANRNYGFSHANSLLEQDGKKVPGMVLGLNGENNVLKLYYRPKTTTVTVNHYYRDDSYTVDGQHIRGEYGDPTVDTFTNQYVGDRYPTAGEISLKDQNGVYKLVTSDEEYPDYVSDPRHIGALSENAQENVVNLYYVKTTDARKSASVDVTYIYQDYNYQLNADGRYEKTQVGEDVEVNGQSGSLSATKIPFAHTVSVPDKAGADNGYDFVSVKVNGSDFQRNNEDNVVFDLNEGENTVKVVYERVTDNRGPAMDITVNHRYTRTFTTLDESGNATTETNPDGVIGHVDTVENWYAGETFDFDEDANHDYQYTYESIDYTGFLVDGSRTLVVSNVPADNILFIDYVMPDQTPTTTVTVNHIFRTWVSTVNEDTGDISWTLKDYGEGPAYDFMDCVTYPKDSDEYKLYVGQKFTVTEFNPENHTGYEMDGKSEDSDKEMILTDSVESNVLNVYYDAPTTDPTVGSVAFVHEYYERAMAVVDGALIEQVNKVGSTEPETVYGVIGDIYTIEEVKTFENMEYPTRIDGLTSLDVKFTSGTPATVVLKYERDAGDSKLTAARLDVTHSYYVKHMTVDEETKVAGYYEDPSPEGSSADYVVKDKSGNSVTDLYVGMLVTVEKATSYTVGDTTYDYTPRNDNPALTLTLQEEGNTLELNYDRLDPLPQVDIVVKHTYRETEYAYVDGVEIPTEKNPVVETESAVRKYVGESFTATPIPKDFTLSSAKDGETNITPTTEGAYVITASESGNTVDFVYNKDTHKRAAAEVIVNHYYTDIDFSGAVVNNTYDPDDPESAYVPDTETIGSYAGLDFTVTPKLKADEDGKNGYTLENAEANPDFKDPASALTIVVSADGNEINLYYSRNVETRTHTAVQVIHNYWAKDTFIDGTVSDADYIADSAHQMETTSTETFASFDQGVWVGNSFTAETVTSVTFDQGTDQERVETYDKVNSTPGDMKIKSLAALTTERPNPNIITINYIRHYDSRQATSVTVEHRYYEHDTYTGIDRLVSELNKDVTHSTFDDGVWVGNLYTAAEILADGFKRDTKDEAMSITLSSNESKNKIQVKYVKNVNSDPGDFTVNVLHVDGSEEASQQAVLAGYNTSDTYKVGASYTTAPVSAEVLNEIGYKQIGEAKTEGTAEKGGVVNVTYTYGPMADVSLTVNYNLVAQDDQGNWMTIKTIETETSSHKEGYQYNLLPAKEITGYTYVGRPEVSAPAEGTLEQGKDITVIFNYTANPYPYKVVFYDDYNGGAVLGTVSSDDMMAPYGTILTAEDVQVWFPEGSDWINSKRPSGYNAGAVTYPTVGVSPEGAYKPVTEGSEETVWDGSAITNIVAVRYTYTPSGDGGDPSYNYYTVTVNYLEEGSGDELAASYVSGRIREGNSYDVTARTERSISGYTISSVDGSPTGRLSGDVEITVWYVAETTIPDDPTPEGNTPGGNVTPPHTDDGAGGGDEMDIGDGDVPLSDGSDVIVDTGDGDEVVIVDEGTPLGNLPQTGTMTTAADPTATQGYLAFAASLAAAGLAFVMGRKKEENEEA